MELYKEKEDCCGCGACMNACPQHAIKMLPDEIGFIYPKIDQDKCVECGVCINSCKFRKSETYLPIIAYVAVNQSEKELMSSASGGVFTAIASEILQDGGVVFGATIIFDGGHAKTEHILIDSLEDLWRLQGSKYVQSNIGQTYLQAKRYLQQGHKVLFSGTPCQIAGLKSYLKKEYENLFTIDLICHGVPSNKLFDDYIQQKNRRLKGVILDFKFRDKKHGWGMNTSLEYEKDHYRRKKYSPARLESYCSLFLDGLIYRKNCYSCPFAKTERIGDITVGDYWGIEIAHPELINNSAYEECRGISCMLINTAKGKVLCKMAETKLCLYESTVDKVAMQNKQLRQPSIKPKARETFLEVYKQGGYSAIERLFKKIYGKKLIVHSIYNAIPRNLRNRLKKIVSKRQT